MRKRECSTETGFKERRYCRDVGKKSADGFKYREEILTDGAGWVTGGKNVRGGGGGGRCGGRTERPGGSGSVWEGGESAKLQVPERKKREQADSMGGKCL